MDSESLRVGLQTLPIDLVEAKILPIVRRELHRKDTLELLMMEEANRNRFSEIKEAKVIVPGKWEWKCRCSCATCEHEAWCCVRCNRDRDEYLRTPPPAWPFTQKAATKPTKKKKPSLRW